MAPDPDRDGPSPVLGVELDGSQKNWHSLFDLIAKREHGCEHVQRVS